MAALPADVAATSVLSNGLYLTPVVGSTISVNSVNINGIGAPTYSAQIAFPTDSEQVATHLSAQIDQSDVVFSTYPSGSNLRTIQITARDTRRPFLLNFNANMQVLQIASPVEYEAIEFGPISAPVNSLTQILTPVADSTPTTSCNKRLLIASTVAYPTDLRERALLSLSSSSVSANLPVSPEFKLFKL